MVQPSPNLVFETFERYRLLVIYQTEQAPTDTEWDSWLSAADSLWEKTSSFRLLVFSDGGHPNKQQVAKIESTKRRLEEKGGKERSEPITAIVSSSVAMRFVVSGVNLFNPRIRCYSPHNLDEAYKHLGLAPIEAKAADAAIEHLRKSIRSSTVPANGSSHERALKAPNPASPRLPG